MKQAHIIARPFITLPKPVIFLKCASKSNTNSNQIPVSSDTPNFNDGGGYSVNDDSTSVQPSAFTIPAIDANTYSFVVTTDDIDKTKNNLLS